MRKSLRKCLRSPSRDAFFDGIVTRRLNSVASWRTGTVEGHKRPLLRHFSVSQHEHGWFPDGLAFWPVVAVFRGVETCGRHMAVASPEASPVAPHASPPECDFVELSATCASWEKRSIRSRERSGARSINLHTPTKWQALANDRAVETIRILKPA